MNQLFPPLLLLIGKSLTLVDRANLASVCKSFEIFDTKLGKNLKLAVRLMKHFSNNFQKSQQKCIANYIAHLILGCPYSTLQKKYSMYSDNNMLPHLVNIWLCQSGNECDPVDILVHGVSDSAYVNKYYNDIRRMFYGSKNKGFGLFEYVQVDQDDFPPSAMISFSVTFRGKMLCLDYINVGHEDKNDKLHWEIYDIFSRKIEKLRPPYC